MKGNLIYEAESYQIQALALRQTRCLRLDGGERGANTGWQHVTNDVAADFVEFKPAREGV